MKHKHTTLTLAALMVTLPSIALASQSVLDYRCNAKEVNVLMNSSAAGTTPSISMDGTSLSGTVSIDSTNDNIIDLTAITTSFACPGTTSIAVTIDGTTYTKSLN